MKKTLFTALFLALTLPLTAVVATEVTFGASGSTSADTGAVSNVFDASGMNPCIGITSDLRFGMTSPQVVVLQNFLRDQGFFDAQSTGFFGTITLSAVRSYQTSRGLTANGFVGESTRAEIKQDTCNNTTSLKVKKQTVASKNNSSRKSSRHNDRFESESKRFRRSDTIRLPVRGDGSGVVVRDLVSRNDIIVRTVQIENDSVVGGVFNNF